MSKKKPDVSALEEIDNKLAKIKASLGGNSPGGQQFVDVARLKKERRRLAIVEYAQDSGIAAARSAHTVAVLQHQKARERSQQIAIEISERHQQIFASFFGGTDDFSSLMGDITALQNEHKILGSIFHCWQNSVEKHLLEDIQTAENAARWRLGI